MITRITGVQNSKSNTVKNTPFTGNFSPISKMVGSGMGSSGSITKDKGKVLGLVATAIVGLGASITATTKNLLENKSVPFVQTPITANGKIVHIDPSGNSTEIEVRDDQIKPGCDGQNIYIQDGQNPQQPEQENTTQTGEEQSFLHSLPDGDGIRIPTGSPSAQAQQPNNDKAENSMLHITPDGDGLRIKLPETENNLTISQENEPMTDDDYAAGGDDVLDDSSDDGGDV